MNKDFFYTLFLGLNLTVSIMFTFWYFLIVSYLDLNFGVIYALCVLIFFSFNALLFIYRKKTKGYLKSLIFCCFVF